MNPNNPTSRQTRVNTPFQTKLGNQAAMFSSSADVLAGSQIPCDSPSELGWNAP